jgi:hypothetical protein
MKTEMGGPARTFMLGCCASSIGYLPVSSMQALAAAFRRSIAALGSCNTPMGG